VVELVQIMAAVVEAARLLMLDLTAELAELEQAAVWLS
jgi:hypothetical protein